VIADARRALRVLETSHPPAFYLPLEDVAAGRLAPARGASACEWKGAAAHFDVAAGERVAPRAVWPATSPSSPAGSTPAPGPFKGRAGSRGW
jgi:uncharacterized protein (DUF427 family)